MDTLRNWLRKARGATIPIATTAAMGPAVRRTLLLRVALGVLLIGLVVAAVDTGRSKAAADRGLVPGGIGGMLVLDVSRSIKPDANQTTTNVLQQLIAAHHRHRVRGVSDHPHELLPPRPPAGEPPPPG